MFLRSCDLWSVNFTTGVHLYMWYHPIRLSSSSDMSSISIFFASAFISCLSGFQGQYFLLYFTFTFTLFFFPHLEMKIKILWRILSFHTSLPYSSWFCLQTASMLSKYFNLIVICASWIQ